METGISITHLDEIIVACLKELSNCSLIIWKRPQKGCFGFSSALLSPHTPLSLNTGSKNKVEVNRYFCTMLRFYIRMKVTLSIHSSLALGCAMAHSGSIGLPAQWLSEGSWQEQVVPAGPPGKALWHKDWWPGSVPAPILSWGLSPESATRWDAPWILYWRSP